MKVIAYAAPPELTAQGDLVCWSCLSTAPRRTPSRRPALYQFPLRRHPHLLVDHRRAGSASVADSRGADAEPLTGSGGRLHFGMVAGFKSERWPASNRNWWPDCVGIRTELLSDIPGVDGLAFEGECRVARDHEAVADAREVGSEVFGDAVGEIILGRVVREIGERQHHKGEMRGFERCDRRVSVSGEEIPCCARDPDERDDSRRRATSPWIVSLAWAASLASRAA